MSLIFREYHRNFRTGQLTQSLEDASQARWIVRIFSTVYRRKVIAARTQPQIAEDC